MTKFKVGDRVRLTKDCNPSKKGDVVTILSYDSNSGCWNTSDNSMHGERHLELATPSWDNLQVGDIILSDFGSEAKVLAVIGDVFLRSSWDDFDIVGYWYTTKQAQGYDCTLKGSEDEDTVEVTLEEVAKKFKVDITKIRIKE